MNPASGDSRYGTVVLVNVDDNEGARYARTRLLQRAGFRVHEASDGSQALRLVARFSRTWYCSMFIFRTSTESRFAAPSSPNPLPRR